MIQRKNIDVPLKYMQVMFPTQYTRPKKPFREFNIGFISGDVVLSVADFDVCCKMAHEVVLPSVSCTCQGPHRAQNFGEPLYPLPQTFS